MATRSKRKGRRPGSRNRGYFYRKGRGWCATEGTRAVPLVSDTGERLKDRETPLETVRAAYSRHLVRQSQPVLAERERVTVLETCQLYLDNVKATGAESTYQARAGTLYDFCIGLPASFRNRTPSKREIDEARIHKGYGGLAVDQLLPLHVDQWLSSHPAWVGCRRTKVQALKRALNYGVGAGFLSRNPIRGYKTAKSGQRMTYLTPEQEQACYEHAKPALATAIKVLIRTGARYGCEFSRLTAKHVTMTPKGVEFRFAPTESKTKKLRIIRIPNTEPVAREVIALVEERMRQTGPLFRNTFGEPWTARGLRSAFNRLRKKLEKKGVKLDADACLYSCRHTYAKRTLSGFWTGKPSTIERLAELMGNSRDVCWQHYASWCDSYTDPLWESA